MFAPEPVRRLFAMTAAVGAFAWMTGLNAASDVVTMRWNREWMRRRAERDRKDDEPALFV